MVSAVSQNNNNNYVRVGIELNPESTTYYHLPQKKADSFVKECKSQARKTNFIANAVFFLATMLGVALSFFVTRNIEKSFIRFVLNAGAGVAAGLASFKLTGSIANKKQTEIERKYGAIKVK